MGRKPECTCCTDVAWQGRDDCRQCNVRTPVIRELAAGIGTSMETSSRSIANPKRYNLLRKTGAHRARCGVAAFEATIRATG